MPLKVRISWRTSSTGLPLTAADISEAEDWLMEQPEPPILTSASVPSSTSEADHHLVTAQGVEALDPVGRRRLELAPVPGRAVVVEDDLPVQIFEVGHRPAGP